MQGNPSESSRPDRRRSSPVPPGASARTTPAAPRESSGSRCFERTARGATSACLAASSPGRHPPRSAGDPARIRALPRGFVREWSSPFEPHRLTVAQPHARARVHGLSRDSPGASSTIICPEQGLGLRLRGASASNPFQFATAPPSNDPRGAKHLQGSESRAPAPPIIALPARASTAPGGGVRFGSENVRATWSVQYEHKRCERLTFLSTR